MSRIIGKIVSNTIPQAGREIPFRSNFQILELDFDPTNALDSPIGSIAVYNNGSVARYFYKTGNDISDWQEHSPGSISGTVIFTPSTDWFIDKISKDSVIAPTPGVADAHAMSGYGRINTPYNCVIQDVHFHYDHPHGTGLYNIELWRRRSNVMTMIATCSSDGNLGDFGTYDFTFLNNSYKNCLYYDYFLVQVTSVMTGSLSKDAAGFIDIHYDPLVLLIQ